MSTFGESEETIFGDSDDGLAEALRRDAELESNPALGISLEEFAELIRRRQKR